MGYSPVELKITIPAGRTLEKDVVLNEGVELQEVVVGGAFQGQRRAINSQKNNMGITKCSLCRPGRQVPRLQHR